MPTVSFFLRSNNDKDKTKVLYCRVTVNGTQSEFSLKEKVDPKCWDQNAQKVKSGKSKFQANFVNSYIDALRYKLKTQSILMDKGSFSAKQLIDLMNGKRSDVVPVLQIINDYIQNDQQAKPTTIKNHRAKLANLEQFSKKMNITLTNESFDLPMAQKFIEWFKSTKQTNNKTTAARNVQFCQMVMNWAVKRGAIKSFSLQSFKPEKDRSKPPTFLDEKEVEKLFNHSFQSRMLIQCKDLYLFQISTGLSYGDIWGDWTIKQVNNSTAIVGTRVKNGSNFFIPMNEIAFSILEKYNYQLPRYCNEPYNRALKEIAAIVGIEKKLTTHIGRKTFATIQDGKGWSRESIAMMLGHKSIKTTEQFYIGHSFTRIENEMLRLSK